MVLTIIGIIVLAVALVLAFKPMVWAVAVAWVGLLLCALDAEVGAHTGWESLCFWGVATMLVLGIAYLEGSDARPVRAANAYCMGGAIVGAIVGMIISSYAIVLGALLGTLFGAIAYSRTPGGRQLDFPSRRFWHALMMLGLPAVVTMSMVGIAIATLIG